LTGRGGHGRGEVALASAARRYRRTAACLASGVVLVTLAACSSSSSSSGGGGGSASSGSASDAGAASTPSSGASSSIVEQAKAAVAKAESTSQPWTGPTSAPTPVKGKKVACIRGQADNAADELWCQGVAAGAKAIGWSAITLDGQGTLSGQSSAILQAVSDKVDGIVLGGMDPTSLVSALSQAASNGVTVVEIQGLADPGPAPKYHIFTTVTQSGPLIGQTAGDIAIADSNGTAKVVTINDPLYQIAREKTSGAVDQVKKCSGCSVLEMLNSPIAQVNTLFPTQMTALLQKYPGKVYYIAISDAYFDAGAASLRSVGISPSGQATFIGTDGSPAAYQRIKSGQYEIATIPPPEVEQGWQAIDELNRAFNKKPWSGYVPPIQVITKSNVGALITAQGYYQPQNGYVQHYESIWGV
jgi:ribose transport system substrate-binding protein